MRFRMSLEVLARGWGSVGNSLCAGSFGFRGLGILGLGGFAVVEELLWGLGGEGGKVGCYCWVLRLEGVEWRAGAGGCG